MPEHEIFSTINQETDSEPTLEERLPDAMLFMAMEDLDASIILYYRGLYPQSVYCLQQAVEKLGKSLGYFLDIITEEDAVKFVRHQPLNILKKFTSKFARGLEEIETTSKEIPEFRARLIAMGLDFKKLSAAIKALTHAITEHVRSLKYNLSEDDLVQIFTDLDDKIALIDKMIEKNENQGISETDYNEIREQLTRMYLEGIALQDIPEPQKTEWLCNMQDSLPDVIPSRDLLEEMLTPFFILCESSYILFGLSSITAPHEDRTRYPRSKEGFDPLEYYTVDCPLVKVLPDLHHYTRVAIERIDLLYDLASDYGEEHQPSENAGTMPKNEEI